MRSTVDLRRMLRAMGAPLLLVSSTCASPDGDAPGPEHRPLEPVSTSRNVGIEATRCSFDGTPRLFTMHPVVPVPLDRVGRRYNCTAELPGARTDPAPTPYAACASAAELGDGRGGESFSAVGTAECTPRSSVPVCCYESPSIDSVVGRAYRARAEPERAMLVSRSEWIAALELSATGTGHGRRVWRTPICSFDVTRVEHGCERAYRADVARSVRRSDEQLEFASLGECLGHEWAAEATEEHASIASFSRLSLQLMARGAPPHLIARVHRAALQEIEHARSAFGIASSLLGYDVGPGPLAAPTSVPTDRETLIAECVIDGCVGELAATYVARGLARSASEAPIRRHHSKVAREELQHAELAFAILAWLVDDVRRESNVALRESIAWLEVLASQLEAEAGILTRVSAAPDASRRRAGRPDEHLLRDSRRRAVLDVVLPCLRSIEVPAVPTRGSSVVGERGA